MDSKKGMSFLEIIFALSILTVGIVGLIQSSGTTMLANTKASQEIIATSLARGFLAEIISKNFSDPQNPTDTSLGPNMGSTVLETRQGVVGDNFDDVDDYNGTTESPPKTVSGTVMNGMAGTPDYSLFSRNVSVKYVNFLIDGTYVENPGSVTTYKKATVTVTAPGGKTHAIDEVKTQ
jgi:type II secretory pathway pseudopilin PulG